MTTPPPIPSASVVIARDGEHGLEVLLARRNAKLAFHGGSWVFPGGKIDAADAAGDPKIDELVVAKKAAVREAYEETGIELSADGLYPIAHWITPEGQPKRFATWFFAATVDRDVAVRIDQSEIVDYRWFDIDEAIESRAQNKITLPAPTFVILTKFRPFSRADDILADLAERTLERFAPKLVTLSDGRCALYHGDAGYESHDFDARGPRHRLLMLESLWKYENTL